MRKYFLIGIIISGIFFNAKPLKAADEPAAVIDEDLEYTYGSVISSSSTEIIVSEYNYETDEEVQTTYTINPETKLSNVATAQALVKDDNVDIYYKVMDGKKVATMITKDETVYESESTEEGDTPVSDSPDNAIDPQTNSTMDAPAATNGNETRG